MSHLFPERIETDRLVLTAITEETDPLVLYEHVREGAPHIDAITRYVSWDPHPHPKVTRDFVEMVADERRDDEGSTYVVRPAEGEANAGELAGVTSLSVDWDRRVGTLGLWLRKPFWGRGYSGERAAALFDLAFERLDLEVVAVAHHDGNAKSRRAIEQYVEAHGGEYEGRIRNAELSGGEPVDRHRYSVTREEYRAATGPD